MPWYASVGSNAQGRGLAISRCCRSRRGAGAGETISAVERASCHGYAWTRRARRATVVEMRYIVDAGQMQMLDLATIEELLVPGVVLMENAGRAVVDVIVSEAPGLSANTQIAVVCGAGNNGGDGYVIARWLRARGFAATVYLATEADRLTGDARAHFDMYQRGGGPIGDASTGQSALVHRNAIESADIVVDCLFGTGLSRPVEGHYRTLIDGMNASRGWRIAVDIPSGLSADSGVPWGIAVCAHRTVTMAFYKRGVAFAAGLAHCGVVSVADIGIPRQLAQSRGVAMGMMEHSDMRALLPPLAATDYKNRRGHALVIAGSPGKRGAGRLAAAAALRIGAGLVTLAGPGDAIHARDEIMTARIEPSSDAATQIAAMAERKRALAIGPGMDTSPHGRALVMTALQTVNIPMVLDADALNHIGTEFVRVAESSAPVVLTPHPGEAARLLDCTIDEVENNRVDAVVRLARETKAIVVLKGPRTLICDGHANGFVYMNPSGNPALATAGTGDVLTGLIVGLLAQGATPADAARLGVYIHGAAADRLVERVNARTVVACDLLAELSPVLNSL